MNTPSTTGRELDRFETALLAELTEHVAARDAVPDPTPLRRHGRRRAAGLVAAAAAVTAFATLASGPGTDPAYAVATQSNGDVVVTINRLEDSAGLEAELNNHGLDVDVYYRTLPDMKHYDAQGNLSPALAPPGFVPSDHPECPRGDELVTLTRDGEAWMLRIPAESALHGQTVQLAVGEAGQMSVFYSTDFTAPVPVTPLPDWVDPNAPISCWVYEYAG